MISINNEPVIDMMKVISHEFIEDHINKIKIEPTKYSIIVKYIRDPMCSIRDIIIVFNGNGILELTGLLADGTLMSRKQFEISTFEKDPNLFITLLHKNFFGMN